MANLIEKLDKERNNALTRITALSGAIQQCDQFLQQLDSESDAGNNADSSIPDKKIKSSSYGFIGDKSRLYSCIRGIEL